jgi:hypothetical protein
MKVLRRGQDRRREVKTLFDMPISSEKSLCGKAHVKTDLEYEPNGPFEDYFDGVRILAEYVPDINKSDVRHSWGYELQLSDLCEIVRAIRLGIEKDKSGDLAKRFAPLIGEFAQTVATSVPSFLRSEEDDVTEEENQGAFVHILSLGLVNPKRWLWLVQSIARILLQPQFPFLETFFNRLSSPRSVAHEHTRRVRDAEHVSHISFDRPARALQFLKLYIR